MELLTLKYTNQYFANNQPEFVLPQLKHNLFQGTGSYPLPPQGWHLDMRFTLNQKPLNTPYFLNASIE
jgi:hypothetical protein